MPATVKVLIQGYLSADRGQKTCPTITLVTTKDFIMLVDPGTVEDQQEIINALEAEDLTVDDVDIVAITHSHFDHYKNVALFPKAKVLEYWGLWDQGKSEKWQENFSDDVRIMKTPGHDYSGLTFFIKTDDGVVAICGDVFWKENWPEVDPYASDLKKLEQSRSLVLKMAHWIIPGHDKMYMAPEGKKLAVRLNGKKEPAFMGRCRKCKRAFIKPDDKCTCRPWLCYRCCMCKFDCDMCNCEVKKGL